MKVFVAGSRAVVARQAAETIASVLRGPGRSNLVLSSGRTMVPVYGELVRLHRAGRAPLARAITFCVDELRVPADDPRSFRAFMERHLFRKVRLPERRIHFLSGDAPDAERECARFERELARAGGVDLVLLGIGANGHIAYLEPARALPPRAALVRLSASTRRGLAAAGARPVPREALTMGLETILSAREVLLVATGRSKAAIVARALHGRITPKCPASYLSLHPRLTVVLDREAASKLWLLWSRPRVGPASHRPARAARGDSQTRRSGRGRLSSPAPERLPRVRPLQPPSGRRARRPGSHAGH